MRPAEFIIWLKGFVAASNNYNLTPAGWETLKEELAKVNVVSPCSGHAFESDQHEEYDIEKLEEYEDQQELEDDFFGPWEEPNEHLIEAARRYKEVMDEYDDYGQRIYKKENRPTWYSTSTSDNLNN